MIGWIFIGTMIYLLCGYATLIVLDLLDSGLTRNMPTRGHGSVTVPLFLWMAWPFAILLYILMVPVLMVKGIVYTIKNAKEWL